MSVKNYNLKEVNIKKGANDDMIFNWYYYYIDIIGIMSIYFVISWSKFIFVFQVYVYKITFANLSCDRIEFCVEA